MAQNSFKAKIRLRESLTGYLFITPAIFLISLFGIFPIGYAVYMSLHRWRIKKGDFQGFENYFKIFGDWWGALAFLGGLSLLVFALWVIFTAVQNRENKAPFRIFGSLLVIASLAVTNWGWKTIMTKGDDDFLGSLIITLYYSLGTVPTQILVGLVIAYALFQNVKGQEFFRMMYFLPYVTPVVAAAVVFRVIFSEREAGFANQFFGLFGIDPLKWLAESKPLTELIFGLELNGIFAGPSLALIAIMIFGIWSYAGYNAVILLAGLSGIPKNLYEAAEIDGATSWQSFRNITVPLLSPVIFFLAVTGFIGTFQAFNHIFVMRSTFSRGTVDVTSVEIFDTFYKANKFGYAAAESIVLFAIILLLTIANFTIFNRRVFYG